MKRRRFLKVVTGAVGAGAVGLRTVIGAEATKAAESAAGSLPRRVLGRTGEKASVIGFPGLCLVHAEQDKCTEAIHDAFKRGVNYFDVAPAYGNGVAETRMGIGLEGIARDQYLLACKTKMRDKEGAARELEQSLKLLKTDRLDVYQMHCLKTPEEVKQALGKGGAIETFLKAKEEGTVKYLGFSAHTTRGALEAMKGFRFDTVMFPINFVEYHTLGFGKDVLDLAAEQGAAVLAIKPMCRGAWPEGVERTRRWWYRPVEDTTEIDLALRFTLSRKGVVAGFPPAFIDLLDKAIQAAPRYKPLDDGEAKKVKELALSCESIFRREEEAVARAGRRHPVFPDSPHESCPGAFV